MVAGTSPPSPAGGSLRRSPSQGKLFPEAALVVAAPPEFFCPLSQSLMLEPVSLMNTGQNFDRRSLGAWRRSGCQRCPITGVPLEGWVMLRSNEELREEIREWADSMQLNLDLVATTAFRLLDKHSSRAAPGQGHDPRNPFAGASPAGSLLANAFAVPEENTWAQQGMADAVPDRWLAGPNPSTDSNVSSTSAVGNTEMLHARSRSL